MSPCCRAADDTLLPHVPRLGHAAQTEQGLAGLHVGRHVAGVRDNELVEMTERGHVVARAERGPWPGHSEGTGRRDPQAAFLRVFLCGISPTWVFLLPSMDLQQEQARCNRHDRRTWFAPLIPYYGRDRQPSPLARCQTGEPGEVNFSSFTHPAEGIGSTCLRPVCRRLLGDDRL